MRSILYGSFALVFATVPTVAQTDSTVRVRLLGGNAPTEVALEAASAPVEIEVDGRRAGRVGTGESATIAHSSSGVTVRLGSGSVSGATARVHGAAFRLRAGRADRQYTGDLTVRADGPRLELVNETPISPYVASVVASELGFDVMEAAKAQAVLARTYALRRAGSNPTYDLDDHQGSQVFRGLTTITATSRLAAERTYGEVMTYAGKLAEGTYFSSSGGHTADNETIWSGTPLPYLRGVPDPYDADSPHYSWLTRLSKAQVLSALAPQVGRGATGVVVEERSRSGRVTRMRALGAERPTFSGAQFRQRVNAVAGWRTIRSSKFDLSLEGDEYVLRGNGFGHGVGMSQYGAMGLAQAGRGYHDILRYYFTGVTVEGGRALPAPALNAEPIRHEPAPQSPSQMLLRAADRRREGTGSHLPAGDAVQVTGPQPTDNRVGDRRSGLDRRSGTDRRTGERAVAGRREAVGRRHATDRRQTALEAPAAEQPVQRRSAW